MSNKEENSNKKLNLTNDITHILEKIKNDRKVLTDLEIRNYHKEFKNNNMLITEFTIDENLFKCDGKLYRCLFIGKIDTDGITGYIHTNIYKGFVVNGKRQGFGESYNFNRLMFKGEWLNDERIKGIEYTDFGEIKYEGSYENNKYKEGKYYFTNRTIEGDLDGRYFTNGIIEWKTGEKFIGSIKEDVPAIGKLQTKDYIAECDYTNNKFVISYISGSIFEGKCNCENHNNLIILNGTMKYKDGDIYEGEFKNGEPFKGTMKYTSGNIFKGDFKYCIPFKGTMEYISGNIFEGEFVKDGFNGKGIMQYANGDKYEGEFMDSYEIGYGITYYANGDKYEGEWRDGLYDGMGILYTKNGPIYKGYWKEGKQHGIQIIDGVYSLYNNDTRIKTINENSIKLLNDDLISINPKDLKPTKEYIYNDKTGMYYYGDVVNGKANGHGKLVFPGYKVVIGIWINNVLYSGSVHYDDTDEYEKIN